MSEQQQSLEPITNPDPYLDLIREVTGNPDLSAEKLKILVDMRLRLEDREAEKQFDAAMLEAQGAVQEIAWDKHGGSNNYYASYPKIERMLRPVRTQYGFTQSWDTEPGPTPEIAILCCDVIHRAGHKRRYRTPMPIDGQGPKGGGVMTKNQAVNAGTSYGMRNLDKMIWNIPILVDKDDTDGNPPREYVSEKQLAELTRLAKEVDANIPQFVCYMLDLDPDKAAPEECTLDRLPASFYDNAVRAFERKREVLKKAK